MNITAVSIRAILEMVPQLVITLLHLRPGTQMLHLCCRSDEMFDFFQYDLYGNERWVLRLFAQSFRI